MAVAAAILAVQVCVMGWLGYVLFRRVLGVPVWSTARAVVPGALAAVLAAAAGTLAHHLDPLANRFLDLAVSGTVAGLVAVTALLLLDRQARSMAGQAATALRRRRAVAAGMPALGLSSPEHHHHHGDHADQDRDGVGQH